MGRGRAYRVDWHVADGGVARNLDANLDALCKQQAFDLITAEGEAPLGIAVGFSCGSD
ncbi:MAG: hypothetical protein Ct9H300mP8_00300 [Gammaproteobacteria bacterium]|nr:MAG: hypothetical protein Ct9H300mP8_00300 [Gammaproteobacteria bacterium]